MAIKKKHSYWSIRGPRVPGQTTPGIPLDEYCIPFDAALVSCDLENFTCKDIPLHGERKAILQKENSPPHDAYELDFRGIIKLLNHIRRNRDHYCPQVGTQKWAIYPYKKLRFYRKDKLTFYITGEGWPFPVSTKMILTNKYTKK